MASIRDVAKLAQVAPSTVSLVLNNKGYVSEASRKKVLDAIEKLNYVPNELARNLYRNSTNIIGIIVPDVAHPFFGAFIGALEIALYKYNYKIMVCSTIERENAEHEIVDMLRRQMIDGIIMGCHSLEVDLYDNVNKPIVAFDRIINNKIPIIRSDHEKGGRLAAQAMLKAGCKYPLQITGIKNSSMSAYLHHSAFKDELSRNGIEVINYEMEWNKFDMNYFKRVAVDVFEKYPHIDGVYGADMVVCACLGEARKRKLDIPKDIKFIAYDGTFITESSFYNITAIVQPINILAQKTAQMIVSLIKNENIEKADCAFVPVYGLFRCHQHRAQRAADSALRWYGRRRCNARQLCRPVPVPCH